MTWLGASRPLDLRITHSLPAHQTPRLLEVGTTMTQVPLFETASADHAEADKLRDDKTREIAPDLAYRQFLIVNVMFFGVPGAGDGNWLLSMQAHVMKYKLPVPKTGDGVFSASARVPLWAAVYHGTFHVMFVGFDAAGDQAQMEADVRI